MRFCGFQTPLTPPSDNIFAIPLTKITTVSRFSRWFARFNVVLWGNVAIARERENSNKHYKFVPSWKWPLVRPLERTEKKNCLLTLTRPAKTDSLCQIWQSFQFRYCVNDDGMMEQWSLIQNQPLLKTIYLKPPIISYKRGKCLKDTLVRSKI